MHYLRVIITLIFVLPGIVNALSLHEAVMVAEEQATELQKLRAQTRQAEALHQQSAQAFLPSLSVDATWLRADSSLITGIPVPAPGAPSNIRRIDLGPLEGTVGGLQLIQPVFNPVALKRRQAAELNVDARRHAQRWGKQALRLEVARRYFNIVRSHQHQQAAKQSRQAADKAMELALSSYREGLAAKIDVEQANAELASAEARIIKARAATQQAQYQLQSLLGMTPDSSLRLTDALPRPRPPTSDGNTAPRRDLLARQSAVEAARTSSQASRADWIPRVNLLARQQWARGSEPIDDRADGWLVAVNLQWTLFDGFGRQGRIAEAQAKTQEAIAELEQTRRRISQEQAISTSQWRAGFTAWQATKKSVEAADIAAQLAFRRYEENIGSMTDLLAARARLERERAVLIDARYQAVLADMNDHLQHGRDPLLALGGSYQ